MNKVTGRNIPLRFDNNDLHCLVAYGRAVLNSCSREVQAASPAAADTIDNLDSGEQLLELSYGAQITQWLLVRPDGRSRRHSECSSRPHRRQAVLLRGGAYP